MTRRSAGVLPLLLVILPSAGPGQEPPGDWRDDWVLAPGLSMEVDVDAFDMPTAIAFVPDPGPGPKDALYFVTEILGTVKVVTNDRTVITFAEDVIGSSPAAPLPAMEGETGMAGICLDPDNGYVFATFAYEDEERAYRNDIIRFHTRPGVFSTAPDSSVTFTEVFAGEISSLSHQIGPCQVHEGMLYVSVGDGEQPYESQRLTSLLGSIARMTLDGEPVPENPFYSADGRDEANDYVYALGLRNPFSLTFVGDRLFAADNGPHVDRFLEIRAGENYLWDGTDWSIGAAADAVIAPSPSPVQMDYLPLAGSALPPPYRGRFLMATSGLPWQPGPGVRGAKGIIALPYDLEKGRPAGPPETLLQYQGSGHQALTALTVRPDGVYVATLFPLRRGRSAVLKVTGGSAATAATMPTVRPRPLFFAKGCAGCHMLDDFGGRMAPRLDPEEYTQRAMERLNSDAYEDAVRALDEVDSEYLEANQAARSEVLAAEGLERVRRWTLHRILEPRFDNPESQMPDLGLTEQEARIIADFLVVDPGGPMERLERRLREALPRPRYVHFLLAFVLGFGAAWLLRLIVRRRTARA